MTAKEFLRQYEYAERRIRRLEKEYEEERILIDAIRSTSDNDGMPHGNSISKPTEDRAIKLADRHMKLVEARLEAIEIRQQVFEVIDKVHGVEGDVLYERYINLRKWEDICVMLNFSWRGIHKIHGKALGVVQDRLDQERVHRSAHSLSV